MSAGFSTLTIALLLQSAATPVAPPAGTDTGQMQSDQQESEEHQGGGGERVAQICLDQVEEECDSEYDRGGDG